MIGILSILFTIHSCSPISILPNPRPIAIPTSRGTSRCTLQPLGNGYYLGINSVTYNDAVQCCVSKDLDLAQLDGSNNEVVRGVLVSGEFLREYDWIAIGNMQVDQKVIDIFSLVQKNRSLLVSTLACGLTAQGQFARRRFWVRGGLQFWEHTNTTVAIQNLIFATTGITLKLTVPVCSIQSFRWMGLGKDWRTVPWR